MAVNSCLKMIGLAALMAFGSLCANAQSLNQGAYVPGTTTYQYGYNSIPNIQISGAPADTDFKRSAMLHDGSTYRLYFFKKNSTNTLYQFGWNGSVYQYGYNSIPILTITGAPADANPQKFAMLHDGTTYRLYFLSQDKTKLHQFGWDGSSYKYGYNSIPVIPITGAPADTDKNRWEMLHDGKDYRLYFAKSGVNNTLYQFAWNGASYQYGYNSIPVLTLQGFPANSDFSSFDILHDDANYRIYFIAP
ncbi:MAG TPA: hypothetical protein PKD17_19160 [Cellvibrionaceae bacterium]|nr:hypothetical protein [Cellvibrionaceae bacterium]HMW73955.1 hypothetical protein [Cellvibrionaceae bacterium]